MYAVRFSTHVQGLSLQWPKLTQTVTNCWQKVKLILKATVNYSSLITSCTDGHRPNFVTLGFDSHTFMHHQRSQVPVARLLVPSQPP